LVLSESKEVLRAVDELIIVAHRLGIVLANAGIDASNVGPQEPVEQVLLLPKDPDRTARKYRASFLGETGADVGVIINDSVGRAWRTGTVSLAIGVAGVKALEDHRGKVDLFGVPLKVSEEAVADELASAASLIQGQAGESLPVVLIRGFKQFSDEQSAATLVRPLEQDLFR
jgi:coenzyme F420-0:L-glutamate ligase/coenzyme F420-1:gamma-L-glutamate ligase